MPDVRRLPATNVLQKLRKPNERPASRQRWLRKQTTLIYRAEFIGLLCMTPGSRHLFASHIAGLFWA